MADLNLNVNDPITAAEETFCFDICTFAAFDPITMTEQPALAFDVLNANVDDNVLANESGVATCPCSLSVFDDVAVAEVGTIYLEVLGIDSATVTEIIVIELSFLKFEVDDDVVVADVPIMNDLVIELGPAVDTATATDVLVDILFALPMEVSETITVVENVDKLIDQLFLFVSEAPSIVEFAAALPDGLNINVNDSVLIQDHGDIFPFITVNDVVTITEFAAAIPDLSIFVEELHFAVENVTLFDIIIELGPVIDTITVLDVVIVPAFDINLFVAEPIGPGITEFFGGGLVFLFMSTPFDTLGAPIEAIIVIIVQIVDVFDGIAVLDVPELLPGLAETTAFDSVVVNEVFNAERTPIDLFAQDPVTITEFAIQGTDVFDLVGTADTITTTSFAIATIELDLSFNNFLRSYPFVEDNIHNILVEQFENGAEQRRDKWGRSRKRFTITFAPRSKAEMDLLKSFYNDRSGSFKAFNFTNPLDSIVYLVRFEESTLETSRTAFGVFVASFALVEVF